MTQDEQLRLWAYQWVTRGKPELPDGWTLFVVDKHAADIHFTPADDPLGGVDIDLRGFIVDYGPYAKSCDIGYNAAAKVFVVTEPVQENWELTATKSTP